MKVKKTQVATKMSETKDGVGVEFPFSKRLVKWAGLSASKRQQKLPRMRCNRH